MVASRSAPSRKRARPPASQDLDGELPPHGSNGHAAEDLAVFEPEPDEEEHHEAEPEEPGTEPTEELVATKPRRKAKATKSDDANDPDSPESLIELAERVNSLHQRALRHQEHVNKTAIEVGCLLMEAKRRLKRGDFGAWLREHVEVAERQARRYVQLARSRDRLDRLNPTWMSELSLSEALDLVSEPRVAAVDRMESDPRWTASSRRGVAGDSATPTEKAGDDEITPEALANLFEKAKAEHRERLKRLPEIVRALGFFDGSSEFGALRGLQQAFAASCYRFAESVHTCIYASQGYDRESIALGLAARFLKESRVKDLFAPSEQEILWSL
jgi:hypothetical protein